MISKKQRILHYETSESDTPANPPIAHAVVEFTKKQAEFGDIMQLELVEGAHKVHEESKEDGETSVGKGDSEKEKKPRELVRD